MKINITSTTKKNLSNLSRLSKKKLVKIAKLSFSPEQAKIGPALAQLGINSMEFCERFNFQTRGLDKDLLIYVRLSVFSDKSFIFSLKQFQLRDLVSSFDLDSF
jgi:ribosomal protein L11